MTAPLANCTAALAEGRQLEELAELLAREGATVVRCPLLSIHDSPDTDTVVAWLRDLAADRFAWAVWLTGEGVRRLLGFAERAALRDAVLAALGRVRSVTRGPKPVRALKELGLTPTLVAAAPTTEGVIAALRSEPLHGLHVGVQLYSPDNPPLLQFLRDAGATPHPVLPYVYAPAADADRVGDLIVRLADGGINLLVFTSSPQVDRLLEVAKERCLEEHLRQGLERVRVASIGPVLTEHLRQLGVRVDVCPETGFVMKNLVQHIKRHWEESH